MLREKIASVQHDIWAYWMKYMFSVGLFQPDGSWLMPKDKVERWQRQMNTPYADLSPKEQASDGRQADKVLAVLKPTRLDLAFQRHRRHYLGKIASGSYNELDQAQYRQVAARELVSALALS